MNSKKITLALAAVIFIGCNSLYSLNRTWTWTGSTNSDYGTRSNWTTTDNQASPNANDTVVINAGASNYPVLAGNENIRTFIMNGGAFFTNGYDFHCNTNFTINNGNFDADLSVISADNLYLYGGSLTIDGNKIDVNDDVVIDGGTLNVLFNHALIMDDLFLISGTLDLNNWDLTVTDEYIYDGNNEISIVDPGSIYVANLIIDFAGTDVLENSIHVLTSAEFISGILETSSSAMLIFDNNASAIGASNATHVNGPVRRLVSTGTNTTFNFPVGNGVVYAPISISNFAQTRNQDYFTAEYFNVSAPYNHASKDLTIDHISNGEYWILDRESSQGASTTDVNVRLSFNTADRSGPVDNATELRVARWDGVKWVNHGRTGGTGNNAAGTFMSAARITNFSPFTIGSTSTLNALPVSLLNFQAEALDKQQVKVSWATTSEINNDFFIVQKSLDGKTWSAIGRIEGVENSSQLTNYNFIDPFAANGVQFYRLVQTDLDGASTFSHIATVNFTPGAVSSNMVLYPNPASTNVSISLSESASNASITVFNSMGVKVMEINNLSGAHFNLDMSEFERGLYTIEIRHENGVNFSKILKN